jgi:exodeoxyribonuclease VII small subunit
VAAIKEDKTIPKDIAKLTFEEAYVALKDATSKLEAEEVDLDATLKEYARASALARHCANLLDEAEDRIKVLVESEGVIELTDFNAEE